VLDRASIERRIEMPRALVHAVALALLVLATLSATTVAAQGTPAAQATPVTEDVPTNLVPPDGSVLLFELVARGVQIYACDVDPDDATAYIWIFQAPEADLLNRKGEVVGHHFAGPTWQGSDGSAVVGTVLERADAPEPGAIPWLLLEATEHEGSGVFSTVTHIQRLDTVGGAAPVEICDEEHAGEEASVPYAATYAFFYPALPATPEAATPAA
jgi:hypothetical protein